MKLWMERIVFFIWILWIMCISGGFSSIRRLSCGFVQELAWSVRWFIMLFPVAGPGYTTWKKYFAMFAQWFSHSTLIRMSQSAVFERLMILWLYIQQEPQILWTCIPCSRKCSPSLAKTGWWFGTWLYFSIYWECHNPNWRTHIFWGGRSTTNPKSVGSWFHQWAQHHGDWAHQVWRPVPVMMWRSSTAIWAAASMASLLPGDPEVVGWNLREIRNPKTSDAWCSRFFTMTACVVF